MPWREYCEFWQSAMRSMVLGGELPPYGFGLGNHLRAEKQADCGRLEVGSVMTTWFEVTRTKITFQLKQSLATLAAFANPM